MRRVNYNIKRLYMRCISMVLAVVMVICSVPVTTQGQEIQPALESHTYTSNDFAISYSETSSWSNYSVVDVNITNNSDKSEDGWKLKFNYDGTIDNIWNADILSSGDGQYEIIAKDYNRVIDAGQTVNIGFMAYGVEDKPSLPEDIKVITDSDGASDDGDTSDETGGADSSDDATTEDSATEDKDEGDTDEQPTIGSDSGVPEALKALNYTVFSGGDQTLGLYTNTTNIKGSVHTNGDYYYQGTKLSIEGALEACDGIKLHTSSSSDCCDVSSQVDNAEYISMSYITTELKNYSQTEGIMYETSAYFPNDNIYLDKPIYIDGGCQFNTTSFIGQGIVYATDSIMYNVGSLATQYDSRIFLASENGDITLNGSDIAINGVLYAPNGTVTINANTINIKGRIIADKIQINATTFNVESTPHDFDVLDFVFEPEFDLDISGNQKVNRKITMSLTGDDLYTKFISDDVKWDIKKVTEITDTKNSGYYAVDESTSDGFYKEMLFYEAGTYDITATISNGTSEYAVTKQVVIGEDYAPVAALEISEHFYRRDETGVATIDITDLSASMDGDALGEPNFSLFYDVNNDGVYGEDELLSDVTLEHTTTDDEGNADETHVYKFTTENVGKYKVMLGVTENYTDTIPHLLKDGAYLSDDTSDISEEVCVFEVGNVAPEASINVEKAKAVDIVFTVGDADLDKANSYSQQISSLEEELTAQGMDVKVEVAGSSVLGAQDTFAWTEYDHEGFDEYPDHIIYEEDSIKMIGYTEKAYKDFLFVNETEPGTRIFEFDMQRDLTDWHSMEGGGFLFDARVSEEENTIEGYCFLVSHGNLLIIKINPKELDAFINGGNTYEWIYYRGEILASVPLENQYENHSFKLLADSNYVSLYADGKLVIDKLRLPETASSYGYGPIVSHIQHDCNQRSYFTFRNITMKSITGANLSDIVDGYDFRDGAARYVINLSETSVIELEDDEEIADVTKALVESDVCFIGIGNETNENQYLKLLNATGLGGIYKDIDSECSLDEVKDYITDTVLSREYALGEMITTDDMVTYTDYYTDYEGDELYEAQWEYEYDPAVFEGQAGTVEHITKSQSEPITQFVDAGAYTIRLMVRDNPAGDNDALDSYRLWSDTAETERLVLVHNRPWADVTATVSENPNDENKGLVDVTYTAQDPDHPSDTAKGIREEYFWYKNIKDSSWTEGKIPTSVTVGQTYLIKYQVKDIEGELSKPSIGVVKTSDLIKYKPVNDKKAPEIVLNISKTEAGIGDTINIEAYAEDDYGLDSFSLYLNDELISDGYVKYTYQTVVAGEDKVKAVAKDVAGNESIVEASINIVDNRDLTAPTAIITSPVGEIEESYVKIIGTANDETEFSNFTLSWGISGENEFTILKESSTPVTDDLLGEIDFTDCKDGVYDILLSVEDEAGNISYTGFSVRITTIGGTGNPTLSQVEKSEFEVTDPFDSNPPTVEIISPYYDDVLSEPTDIIGTVYDSEELLLYRVEYKLIDEDEYITLVESTESIEEGAIATLDTTILANGVYDIKLTAFDKGGNKSQTQCRYIIEGNLKVGAMNIGFTDITASMGGMNISVNRMYDSRNKNIGDFGYGWNINVQGVKLYLLNDLTIGYDMVHSGSNYTSGYQMEETASHDIVITYGDGTSDRFVLGFNPEKQALVPIQETTISYTCVTNPNIKLDILCDTSAIVDGGELGFYESGMYDTLSFRLTTEEETKVYLREDIGVYKIEDISGNVIYVDKNGYHSDDGKSITFTRDLWGRVIAASDPAGNTTTYEYDDNGDLVKVTDCAQRSVTYAYDDKHNLVSITDPMGIAIARNEYDEQGRLIACIDAYGNRVEYDYDVDGRTEIVTDRKGYKTVYVYDDDGNVLATTDPYGNTSTNTYDEEGNLLSATDALGNSVSYCYDDVGNLTQVTAADGTVVNTLYSQDSQVTALTMEGDTLLSVDYDDKGRLDEITDANGNTVNYSYTNSGKLKGLSDSIGEYQRVTYDSEGNVATTTNGAGESSSYTYDDSGRVLSVTVSREDNGDITTLTCYYSYNDAGEVVQSIDNDGNTVHYEYDDNGNQTATVDEKGRRITYEYDEKGNLIKASYPDGTFEKFTYDANDNNISATDRNGLTVEMEYDKLNRLVKTTYADGTEETYQYDAAGNVIAMTDVTGAVTTYEYDSRGLNTSITDVYGNTTKFDYDNMGRLIKTTDATSSYVKYEYDANGNVTETYRLSGSTEKATYDARNRMTSFTDGRNNKTYYEYDGADRLTKVTDSLGNEYSYEYDSSGNLISVTDALEHVTRYEYDVLGRVIKVTNALGRSMDYTYDECGNLTSQTDYAGIKTSYNYDDMDRLVKKTVGDEITAYTYDSIGLLKSVTDKSGTISYSYDEYNRLISTTDVNGITISYTYDSVGRLSSFNNGFEETKYEYDLLSRVTKVTGGNGKETTYEYDEVGRRTVMKYPNGVTVKYTYLINHRLSKVCVYNPSDKLIYTYHYYSFDRVGNRTRIIETDNTTGVKTYIDYEYDALSRLTKETIEREDTILINQYTYDAVSNRTSKVTSVDGDVSVLVDVDIKEVDLTEGTTNYTYNALNQLVTEETPSGTVIYTYDNNGSLISLSGAKNVEYSYDQERQLISVTTHIGYTETVESYTYDYAGTRTSKTVNGTDTTIYVVDNSSNLSQVVAESDTEGNLISSYTRCDDIINIEFTDEIWYYVFDGHGSVRMLTDSTGAVTDSYSYDAYGNLLEKQGDTENDYLYVGEQYNANTGLYYLRARYMNPSTGTFTTMDSYQGNIYEPASLHKYMYANTNPVMNTDPSGYSPFSEILTCMNISYILKSPAMFVAVNTVVGGLLGGLLGGIDAALGGGGIKEILNEAWFCLKIGLALSLVISTLMCFAIKYAIILVTLQIFNVALLVMNGVGVLVSISEGKTAQAVFRAILGLFAFMAIGKQIKGLKMMRVKGNGGGSTELPKTRLEVHNDLINKGYKSTGTTDNGYVVYKHPNGNRVTIKPTGEVICTSKTLVDPTNTSPKAQKYNQRTYYDGRAIPDELNNHTTGHYVGKISLDVFYPKPYKWNGQASWMKGE